MSFNPVAGLDENEAEDAYMTRIRFTGVTELGASTTPSNGARLSWAAAGAGGALALGGLLLFLLARRPPRPEAVASAAGQARPAAG